MVVQWNATMMSRITLAVGALLALAGAGGWLVFIRMPGRNFSGKPPALTAGETALRDDLERDLALIAGEIGQRNVIEYAALIRAENFLRGELEKSSYRVRTEEYTADGKRCANLEVGIRGTRQPDEIVVIGAHYDSVFGSPGANDNGTGVVALLALARRFHAVQPRRTLRFVFFVNEEPPHFLGEEMGSLVYARGCRLRKENVVAMLSLETIGYFSRARGSQSYPFPLSLFYPSTGDFIGFVSNPSSTRLLREVVGAFRSVATIPSEGAAAPDAIPGVGWSDQWSFWQNGYPGVMVTDTALFRYPHYHAPSDTPDKIDYEGFTRVVVGLDRVVRELAGVD